MPDSASETRCSKAFVRDCETLSPGQLKKRYPGEYSSWRNMKYRCRCDYAEMAPELEKFGDFLRIMGPRPANGSTIDRIDNRRGYFPGNVRWADKTTQSNNRTTVRLLKDDSGRVDTAEGWGRTKGLQASTIRKRISRGWSDHQAIHGRQLPHLTAAHSIVGDGTRPASSMSELDIWPGDTMREVQERESEYQRETRYRDSEGRLVNRMTRAAYLLRKARALLKRIGEDYGDLEHGGLSVDRETHPKLWAQYEMWCRIQDAMLKKTAEEAGLGHPLNTPRVNPYSAPSTKDRRTA